MKIALIGAMVSEVELLRERIDDAQAITYAGNEFYEGSLAGAPVVLTACGIGKVNAAARTQAMIDRFAPTHIVFTGIAGSLDARVGIGDIVVSTDCVQHDYDANVLGVARGHVPGFDAVGFVADEALRAEAVAALRAAAPETHVVEGRVASGDQFVSSLAQKEDIAGAFGALCCEMEGAAVAQVACLNQVPFVVIRAISDKADGSAEMDYATFETIASHQGADAVQELCRRLAAEV